MASSGQVRQYLAHWFQLGKPVLQRNGSKQLLPQPVYLGSQYSQAFETCWEAIAQTPYNYYLEGTDQAIAELLTAEWEINACSVCEMPVPTRSIGLPPLSCPCHNLPTWPNTELPSPRSPVSTSSHLGDIRDRLLSHQSSASANSSSV